MIKSKFISRTLLVHLKRYIRIQRKLLPESPFNPFLLISPGFIKTQDLDILCIQAEENDVEEEDEPPKKLPKTKPTKRKPTKKAQENNPNQKRKSMNFLMMQCL